MKKIVAIILIALLCTNVAFAEKQSPTYRIEINAASRTLRLFNKGGLVKEYPIAVGKPSTKSPLGNFTIVSKVINPAWGGGGHAKPVAGGDPNNPLGKRWMGLSINGGGSYGIHGNSNSNSIGTFASGGCIRMFNSDVEEVFSKIGTSTPVKINYETVEYKQDKYSNIPVLIVYPDIYKLKNAEAVIKKMQAANSNITQEQAEKALQLARSNITDPIAVCEGTPVFLNNQFVTNDAFIEDDSVYIFYMAALELLGIDSKAALDLSIPVVEKDNKVYINITYAAKQAGGQIKVGDNGCAYLSLNIVKLNGRYLCSYNGSFDKEYLLETKALNTIGGYIAATSRQNINLKELSKQQNWELNADSLNKIMNIEIPLKFKIADKYYNTEAYNGRYYIDSSYAASIEGIQSKNFNLYSYKDKSYYDVFEIMEAYEHQKDDFFTILEVMKPLNSEV